MGSYLASLSLSFPILKVRRIGVARINASAATKLLELSLVPQKHVRNVSCHQCSYQWEPRGSTYKQLLTRKQSLCRYTHPLDTQPHLELGQRGGTATSSVLLMSRGSAKAGSPFSWQGVHSVSKYLWAISTSQTLCFFPHEDCWILRAEDEGTVF